MKTYIFEITHRKNHELQCLQFIGTKEEFDTYVIRNELIIENIDWKVQEESDEVK